MYIDYGNSYFVGRSCNLPSNRVFMRILLLVQRKHDNREHARILPLYIPLNCPIHINPLGQNLPLDNLTIIN